MLTYPIRNLAPDIDQSQDTSCEKCQKLAEQSAYLNQWIRDTENSKLKQQLEKTMEAVKRTIALHKFEQHSSRLAPHPVRSGLTRTAQNLLRPRMQVIEADAETELPEPLE